MEYEIPTFTTEEKRANLIKGVKALRRNKKKAKNIMRDSEGGRCCLCVLANSAAYSCGLPKRAFEGTGFPLEDLSKIFGVTSIHMGGANQNDIKIGEYAASDYNDGENELPEKTHKEIADLLTKEYLKK